MEYIIYSMFFFIKFVLCFLKTVDFLQKYSDIKTPAPVSKHAELNQVFSPPANLSNFHRRDLFDDILIACFVISQTPEDNAVVQTSRSL